MRHRSIFRTPRKQGSQDEVESQAVDQEQQQQNHSQNSIGSSLVRSASRTATDLLSTHAHATPTPHRYGLRARRASRGSFSTPSRCRRTASRQHQHQQHNRLTTPTKTSGSGAAAIRTGSPTSYGVVHWKSDSLHRHPYSRNYTSHHNASASHSSKNNANTSNPFAMASGGKWREEQVLVICPGSRTTMAQLGCGELSPPAHRIPTRMFRDEEDRQQWRPYHTYKRTRVVDGVEHEEWVEDVDEDKDAVWPIEGGRIVQMDAFLAFLDHVHSLLTTTYHNTPIMLMASPQWTRPDCETIARYIFEKTKTPALCLIHSGIATQYGLKWPNMTVIDIGYEKVDVTAIHDGRVINHMDLGRPQPGRHISGGEVFTRKLQQLLESKGFNHDMAEQLKKSGICEVLPYAPTLKKLVELPVDASDAKHPHSQSHSAGLGAESASAAAADGQSVPRISEPSRTEDVAMEDNDGLDTNIDDDGVLDVASIVTSGQTKEFLAKKEKEKERGKPGRKPKDKEADAAAQARPVRQPNSKKLRNTFTYEEIIMEEVPKEVPAPIPAPAPAPVPVPMQGVEGSVAAVPAPAPAPAPVPATESATEPSTIPTEGSQTDKAAPASEAAVEGEAVTGVTNGVDSKPPAPAAADGAASLPVIKSEESAVNGNGTAVAAESKPVEIVSDSQNNGDSAKAADEPPELRPKRIRREVEVGLERFLFADRDEIDRIVSTIYRTIQGVEDMYMRPACWDNLVFVGNGSRLRGLKDNILQTLNARHLISPSTATMFTSELPSNVATPAGTGSQTPVGSFSGAPHQLSSSGVNPLLQAATTASTFGVAGRDTIQVATGSTPMVGSEAAGPASGHHFHSQTPTSIKTIALPTYLSEWSKNGFEEAMFLGAQVAARIAFCLHSNMDAQAIEAQKSMSLSRVDYK
ncbi:actin arp9 [Trichoderma arundinaceum]|uniref:Actin arp9 n=1 Tax=Trichoderma arundinaceum TaxID=490622 RepID=A0A395N7G8_TRIAR|nr:actin arp9 [Trichoderma arundinaceum]